MHRKVLASACLPATLACTCAALHAAGVRVIDLGTLPGSVEAFACDINDRDVVVGSSVVGLDLCTNRIALRYLTP